MDYRTLADWLDKLVTSPRYEGDHALKEHTSIFHAFLTGETSAADAASGLQETIKDDDAGFRLRLVLFNLATDIPMAHEPLVQLITATKELTSADPGKPDPLGAFGSEWRDMHGSLHTQKSLSRYEESDTAAPTGLTAVGRVLNFTAFSAKLVRSRVEKNPFAFFDIREGLEESPSFTEKMLLPNSGLTVRQLRAINLEIAAQWVIHGREQVIDSRNDDFGALWERGLAATTDVWHGAPGFSAARWKVWRKEFLALAGLRENDVSTRTRAAAHEAAELISLE